MIQKRFYFNFIIIVIITFYLAIIGCNNKDTFAEHYIKKKIEKIIFNFVGYEIETPIHVKCSEFENYFKKIDSLIMTDTASINLFISEINRIKKTNKNSKLCADVRMKAQIIYTDNTQVSFCIGFNRVDMENITYEVDDSFRDTMNKLIYNDE